LRHGESVWNKENRFTGWTDVDLSDRGREGSARRRSPDARSEVRVRRRLTSLLKRAIRTLWFALDEMDMMWIPEHRSWRLNERHYGALQGLNKRRPLPGTARNRSRSGGAATTFRRRLSRRKIPVIPSHDRRYADLKPSEMPLAESLKDTVTRFLPYWHGTIAPEIKGGKRVLNAAHGNSLRALVKFLDKMSDQEIVELNIPTGIPLVYMLNDHLEPLNKFYLGDQEAIKQKAAAVANQGKAGT
jgi:2,3-bisphosphoglycerate-dependent phosphoglycerate mutase